MREAIIACLAFAVLSSPLHAESAGSAALKGAAKGAGEGGGGKTGGACDPVISSVCKAQKDINDDFGRNIRGIKPTTAKPTTMESSQTKNRQ
jgi:hypothetical protein